MCNMLDMLTDKHMNSDKRNQIIDGVVILYSVTRFKNII